MNPDRTLPWDWYPGRIPENVSVDESAYLETTFSFYFYRSELACGLEVGRGASTYLGTMFDVGPRGRVKLGDYALVHGARIICDSAISIGVVLLVVDILRQPQAGEAPQPPRVEPGTPTLEQEAGSGPSTVDTSSPVRTE